MNDERIRHIESALRKDGFLAEPLAKELLDYAKFQHDVAVALSKWAWGAAHSDASSIKHDSTERDTLRRAEEYVRYFDPSCGGCG